MQHNGQSADYRYDELDLVDDEPELDLFEDLEEWVVARGRWRTVTAGRADCGRIDRARLGCPQ